MTREKELANRDHRCLSITKIIKNTLFSVPPGPNNALPTCAMKDKEVEESRNTKDSVCTSLTQSKEKIVSMVISDAETAR